MSAEDMRDQLNQVRHPEINQSLTELGMIGKIQKQKNKWIIELKLPFPQVPILSILIASIQEALKEYDTEIITAVMTEEEKEKFFALARKNWAL